MRIQVLTDQSKHGVYAVANATGRTDQQELQDEAAKLAEEFGVTSPIRQLVCLNAAERNADTHYLIIVTQSDR